MSLTIPDFSELEEMMRRRGLPGVSAGRLPTPNEAEASPSSSEAMPGGMQPPSEVKPLTPTMTPTIASPASRPAVNLPAVESPQRLRDESELQRQLATGSGVSQIKSKPLRTLGRIGDIAASIFAPGTAALLPGTSLHHEMTLNQQRGNIAQDVSEEEHSAQAANQNAEAVTRLNPPAKEEAAGKTVETGEGVLQWNPATQRYDVKVGSNKARAESPQQGYASAIEDAIRRGADPNSDPHVMAWKTALDNIAKQSADKTPPHVTAMKNGKAHIMERDPNTGEYSIDRGEAPPSFAAIAPSIRTVDVIDPQTGLPTIQTLSGKTIGTAATGAYGHEMAQAGAVERGGEQLIKDIQANKQQLGTLAAWVKKNGLNTPIADPQLAGLQAELKTFAALQPAMHGFRARSAQEAFENIIGDVQKNPDATVASIRGIMKTAKTINPNLGGGQQASGNEVHYKVVNGQLVPER